jgi:hypothetical protein
VVLHESAIVFCCPREPHRIDNRGGLALAPTMELGGASSLTSIFSGRGMIRPRRRLQLAVTLQQAYHHLFSHPSISLLSFFWCICAPEIILVQYCSLDSGVVGEHLGLSFASLFCSTYPPVSFPFCYKNDLEDFIVRQRLKPCWQFTGLQHSIM